MPKRIFSTHKCLKNTELSLGKNGRPKDEKWISFFTNKSTHTGWLKSNSCSGICFTMLLGFRSTSLTAVFRFAHAMHCLNNMLNKSFSRFLLHGTWNIFPKQQRDIWIYQMNVEAYLVLKPPFMTLWFYDFTTQRCSKQKTLPFLIWRNCLSYCEDKLTLASGRVSFIWNFPLLRQTWLSL